MNRRTVAARVVVALLLLAAALMPAEELGAQVAAGIGWVPLRAALGGLGVLGLGHGLWSWRAGGPTPAAPRVPPALEAVLVAAMTGLATAIHVGWARYAVPDHHLNGYDYNTYALNAIAVESGDWRLYNPDKHAFHARLVAALWGGGPGLNDVLVHVSVAASIALPLAAWALARRAAGATAGLTAAGLTLAFPLSYHFTAQTTAYPTFYLLVTVAGAALLWALQRPGPLTAALAGLTAGMAAATQEKAAIVLLPVAGVAALLLLPSWWAAARGARWRGLARAGLGLGIGLGVYGVIITATTPPLGYTPLVSLVTNQRQEVHVSEPYVWPTLRQVDPADPAGLRSWLPRAFWNGELESWVASVRTPPDSNALRLGVFADSRGPEWRVVPDTTLPPVERRLAVNLRLLPLVVGPAPWPGALLILSGAAFLVVFGRDRSHAAAAYLGAAASVVAPLTLRFGEHYVVHFVPFGAALAAGGYERLVEWLLPGRAVWAGRAVLIALFGAYALSLWGGAEDGWRHPRLQVPPAGVRAPEDPGGYSANLLALSGWLDAHGRDRPIIDCLPSGLLMVRPHDARLSHQIDAACREGLAAPPAAALLFVSSHPEYRNPATPTAEALLGTGRWRVVWAYDRSVGVYTPGVGPPLQSAVVVLEAR